MLTFLIYAILILFGFLTVVGLALFITAMDIFISVFPCISMVILAIELIVSVIFIVKRFREGNGGVKAVFASVLCLVNSAQYLYYQGKETQIPVFLVTTLVMGTLWLGGVVYPWLTILKDGEGEGFGAEIFLTVALFVIIWLWETHH